MLCYTAQHGVAHTLINLFSAGEGGTLNTHIDAVTGTRDRGMASGPLATGRAQGSSYET